MPTLLLSCFLNLGTSNFLEAHTDPEGSGVVTVQPFVKSLMTIN
ncbi:MAG: hypothetical protein SAK29_03765 [Scytonema sp. PMC 1069.18]|nr:hypothetical protein [Scytonema sp. PMC 1069.18]MEC4881592.1 hypothetical protein [Scytonema sp. PMC 1070.18]